MRHESIDGIRGLAILMMVFSGVIPYKVLPAWMYHAQLPPPTNVFNPAVAGITWVDLVFPMFLFAMGVAIPIALARRIADPDSSAWKIHGLLLKRGLLLAVFAIFLQHVRPYTMNTTPDTATWVIALLGFLALWLIFIKADKPYLMSLGAVLGVGIMYSCLPEYANITFSLTRSDIILLVLANMAFYGGVAWYWSRNSILARLSVMAAVAGFILIHPSGSGSPVPWLTNFYFLKYLLIVLPGTILGDFLVKEERNHQVSGFLALSGILITVITIIGLHQRFVIETVSVVAIILAVLLFRHREQRHPILLWAVLWLVLGFMLEPFQGGIHKDPSTFSYYFVTSGLTLLLWFSWMWLEQNFIAIRIRKFIAASGQNPMLAYVAFMNLLLPLMALTGLAGLIASYTASPWMGALRGFIYTLIVAGITAYTVKKSWFWKT